MRKRILLYGATGYSGRLIADEAKRRLNEGSLSEFEVVLGGRDRFALDELSDRTSLTNVVFALDTRSVVESELMDFDVVLNAAGPFADTGIRLAKGALSAGCHYVDINGEVSVYQALDDLGRAARDRDVRLVSGAGFTATMSDIMMRWALELLKGGEDDAALRLGTVRIVVSDMEHISRGSFRTMLQSVREQVTVVRNGSYVHVPVGTLERSFDFAPSRRTGIPDPSGYHIASVANLLDTCVAFETTRALNAMVGSIESYIEMPLPMRLNYQLGAYAAVLLHLPYVQNVAQLQIAQLPEGPDEAERRECRQTILLQVESPYKEPWVDWRMETPNSYDVTAWCALAVATSVTHGGVPAGWITPSQALNLPTPEGLAKIDTEGVLALTDPPFTNLDKKFKIEFEGRPVMERVS